MRADGGGGRLGLGHLARCTALARALEGLGHTVRFATRAGDGAGVDWLRARGLAVEVLPDGLPEAVVARGLDADRIAADHYGLGATELTAYEARAPTLTLVDTPGDGVPTRWALCMHPGARARGLAPAVPLLGPRYALLHGLAPRLPAARPRVLLSFGAGDAADLLVPVARALAGHEVVALVGPGAPADREARLAGWAEVHRDPLDVPGLVASCRVAATTPSVLAYEAATLGVPLVVARITSDQAMVEAGLREGDLARVVRAEPAALAAAVRGLLADPEAREALAARARRVFDGQGAARVAEALTEPVVTVRPAVGTDRDRYLEWANDPAVRASAFSPDPIPRRAHARWFARRTADPDAHLLVGLDASGLPVGQVRLEREGSAWVTDVSVAREHRGRGLAAPLLRTGVAWLLHATGGARVVARIRVENGASRRAFARAGFTGEVAVRVRGHTAVEVSIAG